MAAPTLLIRDELFLRHDAGPGHPENAARHGTSVTSTALLAKIARPVAASKLKTESPPET